MGKNGQELNIKITSYEVLEFQNQRYSSTSVRSDYTGAVNSDVRHHNFNKLFVRNLETGVEDFLEFDGECVSALPGHRISFVYDSIEKRYVAIINHNTQQRIDNPLYKNEHCKFVGTKTLPVFYTLGCLIPFLGQLLMVIELLGAGLIERRPGGVGSYLPKLALLSAAISAAQYNFIFIGGKAGEAFSFIILVILFVVSVKVRHECYNVISRIFCSYQLEVENYISTHSSRLELNFLPNNYYETELKKINEWLRNNTKKSKESLIKEKNERKSEKENPWLD